MIEPVNFEKGLEEIQKKLKSNKVMAVVIISKKSEKEFEMSSVIRGDDNPELDTHIKLNVANGCSQQATFIFSKLKEQGRIVEEVNGQAYR